MLTRSRMFSLLSEPFRQPAVRRATLFATAAAPRTGLTGIAFVGASLLAMLLRRPDRQTAAVPCGLLHFPHPRGSPAGSYKMPFG